MIEIKYSIQNSKIHGKGVFSEQFIAQGSVIWRWTGKEIENEKFKKFSVKQQEKMRHYSYRSKNTGNWYLAEDDIEFLNHSDAANSTEKIDPDSGAGILVAKRIIKKGEEITQDYREFETEADLVRRGIKAR